MDPQRPSPPPPAQHRGLTAIDGALALITVLLIVQMWLLTATLEAFLGGHREAALPSAVASGLLALACFGLYRFVHQVDREVRAPGPSDPPWTEQSGEVAASRPRHRQGGRKG
jgi:Family of unknown function (DUF6755)